MPQAVTPERQVEIIFKHLDRRRATSGLSSRGLLAQKLSELNSNSRSVGGGAVSISPIIAALYASAAVEIWLRSVHSFLISVSLTETSHIWASVSGYYASHYSVRGLAHVLGYFLMHQQKRIATIEVAGGHLYCNFTKSKNKNREHLYYWDVIKSHPLFKGEPIYTSNHDEADPSDVAHRNIANYHDHLNNFPNFQTLNEERITERVDFLSKIQISSVPIPRPSRYPDLDNVQLIAYHRIVKFRGFLDNILGNKINFWKVYRNPAWCPRVINFQLVEPKFIAA